MRYEIGAEGMFYAKANVVVERCIERILKLVWWSELGRG